MTNIPPSAQLQHALSPPPEEILAALWSQFNADFPTETDCLVEVQRRLDREGLLTCRYCGNGDIDRNYCKRAVRCRRCQRRTWLTAGTFFERMRIARPWLAAIWLMEHGVTLSSSRFHKLVGIAQSSALYIFKKITTVIQSHFQEDDPAVPSSLFSPVFSRRSRETPARQHPLAEQAELERKLLGDEDRTTRWQKRQPAQSSLAAAASSREGAYSENSGIEGGSGALREVEVLNPGSAEECNNREKEVYELLSAESVSFDILCARARMPASQMSAILTMLELAGVVMCLPGNRYVRLSPKQPDIAEFEKGGGVTDITMQPVAAAVDFVRLNFHGVSRKYLQNYLAAYWCRLARARWQCGSLFQACIRFGVITGKEILDYVSPALVKISPCQ